MMKMFCDRCETPIRTTRVTRIALTTVTTPTEEHRRADAARYDPATDQRFNYEICDACEEGLRRWFTQARLQTSDPDGQTQETHHWEFEKQTMK